MSILDIKGIRVDIARDELSVTESGVDVINAVLDDLEVSRRDLLVMLLLDSGSANTIEALSKRLGLNPQWLDLALTKLVLDGLVESREMFNQFKDARREWPPDEQMKSDRIADFARQLGRSVGNNENPAETA